MSASHPRIPGTAFLDSSDDRPSDVPCIEDLEAQYSAATLVLWNARSHYLDLHERTGGDPARLQQSWSALEDARLHCTRLMLSIEALEEGAADASCARNGAGFTAVPSRHHARR